MSEWQPIETAPNDREVLGWANAPHLIKWFDKWDYDRRFPEAATKGGWISCGHVVKPTHWMPLPEPPGHDPVAAERERCAEIADSMNSVSDIGDRIRYGLGHGGRKKES